jgi:hypothetical protein
MKESKFLIRRILVAYKNATLNEYSVDKYWQIRDEWGKSLPLILPRFLNLQKNRVPKAAITLVLVRLLIAVWMYGIVQFIILGQFLALTLRIIIRSETKNYQDIDCGSIIFSGTSLVNRSLKRLPSEIMLPKTALCREKPGMHQVADASVRNFHVVDILEIKEAIFALWLSLFLAYKIYRLRVAYPGIELQNYTCFEFVTILIALIKINPQEVWISNHYDRWAVLVDYYCQGVFYKQKSYKNKLNKKKTVIMQHGIEYDDRILLYKMRSIYKIFYFDLKSIEILFKIAIYRPFDVKLEKFSSALNLIHSARSAELLTILFILHPIVTNKMEIILKNLINFHGIYIYLKPHPLQPEKKYKLYERANVFYIEDFEYFPQVNFIISYKSTLALEYEQIGTDVMYVEDLTEDEIKERVFLRLAIC